MFDAPQSLAGELVPVLIEVPGNWAAATGKIGCLTSESINANEAKRNVSLFSILLPINMAQQ